MKYVAIYIPGLGDKRKSLLFLQRQMLRGWRVYGIRTEIFAVHWTSNTKFSARLKELLERIDKLKENGYKVVLVGASAGASTALTAYARRKNTVQCVVSICGQLEPKVPSPALDVNPRLRQSLDALGRSLEHLSSADRGRVLTLRPKIDVVVQPKEAVLKGAKNILMPIVGHLAGIAFGIVFEGRRIARFMRSSL